MSVHARYCRRGASAFGLEGREGESLKDRVVLIVGASGGLGRASALAAARAGASLVLLGRKTRPLEKLYDEIAASGVAQPSIYPLNLEGATPRDYAELAAAIEREFGRLDGIVNAAASFAGLQPATEIAAQAWMLSLHVNLTAPFLLVQACLPLLGKSDDASVVFVLDDPALMRKAFWGAYGVAKHALGGLVSILHQEWENGTRARACLCCRHRCAPCCGVPRISAKTRSSCRCRKSPPTRWFIC